MDTRAKREKKTARLTAGSILLVAACLWSCLAPASALVLSGRAEEVTDNTPEVRTDVVKPSVLNPNTFPQTYQGAWSCETTVTESTIPTVLPGSQIRSEISFYQTADGRTQARYNQPGWVNNKSLAVTFNGTEAKADRTSYYFGENSQGSWAARTRDQFKQEDANTITAKSYVDQYIEGQYVGRYRSVSILHRMGDGTNMALQNQNK